MDISNTCSISLYVVLPDFNKIVSVCRIYMYNYDVKDVIFSLIKHAEKRIAKIEMSMFDEGLGQRIAHLHLNVFKDDIENRFQALF